MNTETSSSTAPPAPTGLQRLRSAARRSASAALLPIMQRAGKSYVGGETIDDALSVAERLATERFKTTLGLWDMPEDTARDVADAYRVGIDRLASSGLDGYLSIKAPAVRFDSGIASELALAAKKEGVRLHFDSHGTDAVEPTHAMLETMMAELPSRQLSTTLPGRWSRSLSDADWVAERGLRVRVVKGQWPDPADPERDLRAGYLEVIDRLAGRAHHVMVASHDVPLAAEAIGRLRAAGTSCELELLFGLPMTQSIQWAQSNGVDVRIYVPYGKGYIPHAVSQLRRNPRFVWWILKELMTPKGA